MASVVIDEFEVVVETPPPPAESFADAPARPPQPPSSGLKPEDVRFLIDRRDARAARLYAH